VPITNGTAKVDFNCVKPGSYNATVYYSDDKKHDDTYFYQKHY